jgi:prefoldin beta subunit
VLTIIMASDNPGANMAAAVEAEIAIFRELEEEIGKMRGDLQTLTGQQNENEMVKQELDLLDDSANIYKMVGPILLKNDLGEAKQTVEKRLEFIGGERKKLEAALAAKEDEARKTAAKVQELQGTMQRAAADAARAIAADAARP